jgi:hypothetical protein
MATSPRTVHARDVTGDRRHLHRRASRCELGAAGAMVTMVALGLALGAMAWHLYRPLFRA